MRSVSLAIALALVSLPFGASAYLQEGAKAPDFQTQGALDGKVFPVKLSDMLKKGPVVLYFYPAAFSPGCTTQAHEFAAANDDFKKAGATVLGMSNDSIQKLQEFSVKECSSKFAVAAASPDVIKAYDVGFAMPGQTGPATTSRSNRTSFVITPQGKIVFVYSDLSPRDHVVKTLAAVRALKSSKRG